jgi:hypothetical protein
MPGPFCHPFEDEPMDAVAGVGIVDLQGFQNDEGFPIGSRQVCGVLQGEIPPQTAKGRHPVEHEIAPGIRRRPIHTSDTDFGH